VARIKFARLSDPRKPPLSFPGAAVFFREMSRPFCHGEPMSVPRWPLLLLLTACGTAGTVATRDAGEVADATLAPDADPPLVDAGRDSSARDAAPDSAPVDASRPPLTPECLARRQATNEGGMVAITFGLNDANVVPPAPTTVTTAAQAVDLRQAGYASDVLPATTPQGPGRVALSWFPTWTPPDLSFTTIRYSARREWVSCNLLLPTGVREPGSAGLIRVDDSAGNLLLLSSITAVQGGAVKIPAAVPLPPGLTLGTAVDANDPCPFGGLALTLNGTDGAHTLRVGEPADFALGATTYTAILWGSEAEPATGNLCGQVVFVVFKKGLFVPPAN